MSKLIEIAKSYQKIDETFKEQYRIDLGALRGLAERRRLWSDRFDEVTRAYYENGSISPDVAVSLLGFSSVRKFRTHRELRQEPIPRTPSQILAAQENFALRTYGVKISDIASANDMTPDQVRKILRTAEGRLKADGHFGYPPELIDRIGDVNRHKPAGEKLTVRYIATLLRHDDKWVRRRLEGYMANLNLDDGGRVRRHYPPEAVEYLKEIQAREERFCISALVSAFGISKKAIAARLRRRSSIKPLYRATPKGRKTEENIYPEEAVIFLRKDLISHPPKRKPKNG